MGLNLNKEIKYTGKHYITNNVDPINNIEKIDSNIPYVLSAGFHAGTIDLDRWQSTLDAYRGIGLNPYGIYGVFEEDNTATPKFLLTANYIKNYGWGTAVPGEFRVGDNVREEKGFLVGKNWLWYTPVKGLNISGPLLRTISSDTNIILSPGFDNLTEFDLENVHQETDGTNYYLKFQGSGSVSVIGSKTIDGAVVIRGSVMFKHSIPFSSTASILIEAHIYDINGNFLSISSSTIAPYDVEDWKRHNYVLRLGPSDNADSFILKLIVKDLDPSYYVEVDNWNAYRVFQTAIDSFDLPETLPENGKSVIYDVKGIRAYWPDAQGNPQLTFEISAADGNAFFAGNMEVRGYILSGPVYEMCNPTDPYNPTYHHQIIGVGINEYALFGIAPNTINSGFYNVGRSKFLLAAKSVQFNKDCDKWYWGDTFYASELRIGEGLYYDESKHDLFYPLTPNDVYQRRDANYYLWFYPGDKNLDASNPKFYPFLRLKGSLMINGYVHSGPIYDENFGKNIPPTIGGCGINQYAIYGIKTIGSGTSEDPYKTGESRFLLSNSSVQFSSFDPYWGDQLFEGELRVGLNILYDETTDDLADKLGNPATDYLWFRPSPQGSALPTKFIVKASIIAEDGSVIPPEAIDGVDNPDDILNDHQQWGDVVLTDVADFLKHSQGYSIQNGLVTHDSYFGFYHASVGGNLYSWKFKVDDTGKVFFGQYGESTQDRKFVYWDNNDLRIEGGLFAYKGFFRDIMYVGDETAGIEIYGGDHSNSNQAKFLIPDPITQDNITTPYIRSIDVNDGFSKGGWIILDDGFASYSKLTGIGRSIHVTTDQYWDQNLSDGTWSRKTANSCTGFLATYDGISTSDTRPACAIYIHDSSYSAPIDDFTAGFGCWKNTNGTYSLMAYNASSVTNRLSNVEFSANTMSSIYLATDKSTHTTGRQGLYLQANPNEPIGFFGNTPVVRPHIDLDLDLWNSPDLADRIQYLGDAIGFLFQKLGEQSDGNTDGMGLFSWTSN